ncbi:MAG TPA: Holliday junction resolvase RuvX [Xanthomonadaceae bacterium]|nr:Holliday junction resolvase RuvX [Xanthomonadaceae bacterium]
MSCVLGFDFGNRRIGVAVGQSITGSASPVEVVSQGEQGPDWGRIDALVREWRPERLLVGLPLTLDGGEQSITASARAFADCASSRYDLPVEMVDERFSSQEADRRFAELRKSGLARRRDAARLDALAAQIIVEQWLQANSG